MNQLLRTASVVLPLVLGAGEARAGDQESSGDSRWGCDMSLPQAPGSSFAVLNTTREVKRRIERCLPSGAWTTTANAAFEGEETTTRYTEELEVITPNNNFGKTARCVGRAVRGTYPAQWEQFRQNLEVISNNRPYEREDESQRLSLTFEGSPEDLVKRLAERERVAKGPQMVVMPNYDGRAYWVSLVGPKSDPILMPHITSSAIFYGEGTNHRPTGHSLTVTLKANESIPPIPMDICLDEESYEFGGYPMSGSNEVLGPYLTRKGGALSGKSRRGLRKNIVMSSYVKAKKYECGKWALYNLDITTVFPNGEGVNKVDHNVYSGFYTYDGDLGALDQAYPVSRRFTGANQDSCDTLKKLESKPAEGE